MRRLLMWSLVAGFTACLIKPTFVSVTPSHGWVDGCQAVILQGHDLGTEGKVRIGSVPLLDLEPAARDPKLPEHAQDVGFKYYGVTGAVPDGKAGFYDVVFEIDGEELVLHDGFYYQACPSTFVVTSYTVPSDANVGSTLYFEGCGLGSNVSVQFLDATQTAVASADLVSDCSTAQVRAEVPALPTGDYTMQLLATDGTVFVVQQCTIDSGDTGTTCIPDILSATAR